MRAEEKMALVLPIFLMCVSNVDQMLCFYVFFKMMCVFASCFFHRSNEAADFDKDGWHRALDVEPFRCFNGPLGRGVEVPLWRHRADHARRCGSRPRSLII